MGDGGRYAEPIDISAEVEITDLRPAFVGNYSYIHIGQFRGNPVAIKVLRPLNGATLKGMRRKVDRERRVWAALEHPNIVPLCGYAEGGETFGSFGALISPWYRWGDAGKYLERFGRSMTLNERVKMWVGVVAGVLFLHTFNPCVVHGDLKPGNILIDDEKNPRLCDFGLARIFADQAGSGLTTTSEFAGTERYLAFELVVCESVPVPSTASDVWAIGCIGLEMLLLQKPYGNRPNNRYGHIIRDISNGVAPALRPSELNEHDSFIWNLLESSWRPDPSLRETAENIHDAVTQMALDYTVGKEEGDCNSFSDNADHSTAYYSFTSRSQIDSPSQHSHASSISNAQLAIRETSNCRVELDESGELWPDLLGKEPSSYSPLEGSPRGGSPVVSSIDISIKQESSPSMPTQGSKQLRHQSWSTAGGRLLNMFTFKTRRHSSSKAISPGPSFVPPETLHPHPISTPSNRRFRFSLPINLGPQSRKLLSDASVKATGHGGVGNMSRASQGPLPSRRRPDPYSFQSSAVEALIEDKRQSGSQLENMRGADTAVVDAEEDENEAQELERRLLGVIEWRRSSNIRGITRRSRPGVTWDIPETSSR